MTPYDTTPERRVDLGLDLVGWFVVGLLAGAGLVGLAVGVWFSRWRKGG